MTVKKFKVYTKDEISEAGSKSILEVAQDLGHSISKIGRDYCLNGDNAFRLYEKTNSFRIYNKDAGGTVIDFVMEMENLNFPNAVSYLLTGEFEKVDIKKLKNEPKEPFKYNFTHNTNFNKAYDYLVNKRGLNKDLIETLHNKRFINEDTRGNIIFPWVLSGEVVGATKQGTYYNPEKYSRGYYKGIEVNSESNFGFNLSIGKPEKLYFFESPIDTLSYLSLNMDIKDTMLVSMDGLKDTTVEKVLLYAIYNKRCDIKEIGYGVDNDRAGMSLYDKIRDFNRISMTNGDEFQFEVKDLIPNNNHINKYLFELYTHAIQANGSEVSPLLLASIHKFETNMSSDNSYANSLNFGQFFAFSKGENDKQNFENYTQKTMYDKIDNLVKKLEQYKMHYEGVELENPYYIPDLINGIAKENNQSVDIQTVEHVEKRIEQNLEMFEDEYFVSDHIHKDWNDVLQEHLELHKNNELGQAMGLEANSQQHAEKIINSHGYHALDKQDAKKYNIKHNAGV